MQPSKGERRNPISAFTDIPHRYTSDVAEAIARLRPQDRDFLERVLTKDVSAYESRVSAIDFVGKQSVLDAGCGFGQWTAALARQNESVIGVDVDATRVDLASKLWAPFPNAKFLQSSLESLPLPDGSIDAAFCYSVIYFTNPSRTLKELHRVLKPQGQLYICTNGWGWYLYNFLERRNPSLDFDPRRYAVQTMIRTLWYYLTGRFMKGSAIVTPSRYMRRILGEAGFSVLALQGEGTINFANAPITPNYKSRYRGLENIYELIAIKN